MKTHTQKGKTPLFPYLCGLLRRHGRLCQQVGQADEEAEQVLGPVDFGGAEGPAVVVALRGVACGDVVVVVFVITGDSIIITIIIITTHPRRYQRPVLLDRYYITITTTHPRHRRQRPAWPARTAAAPGGTGGSGAGPCRSRAAGPPSAPTGGGGDGGWVVLLGEEAGLIGWSVGECG